MVDLPELLTVGAVARQLGQPVHRVDYLIKSRGILPAARAGCYRLFDADALLRIRAVLVGEERKADSTVEREDVLPAANRPSRD